MKLERIILRKFLILIILASVTLGVIFSIMSFQNTRKSMEDAIERVAAATQSELNAMMEQVSMVSSILLSDPDTLSSITRLSKNKSPRENYEQLYFSDNYSKIRTTMNSYFISEKFYRVLFFNDLGDVVYGTSVHAKSLDSSVNWQNVPGLDNIKPGELKVIPVHKDEWENGHEKDVLSFIKRIVGSGMGYIEVQVTKDRFIRSLMTKDDSHELFLCTEDGTMIFSSTDEINQEYWNEFLQMTKKKEDTYYNNEILISYRWCDSINAYVVLVEKVSVYRSIFMKILPYLLILLIGFGAFSFVYSRLMSKELVAPIHALRQVMAETEFQNINEPHLELERQLTSSEELENLYHSYQEMLLRLKNSKDQEKYMSMLQLQAQMDLLQAQVNPHFIYNVLNVISAKGFMADDESICDICTCLGSMLRYSTNTKEKLGTIKEEKEYLELYLNLLKYRYEHRLQFHLQFDEAILGEEMPKIVLQQIVENSISHGYTDKTGVMQIEVVGTGTPEQWQVHVRDNGDGMTEAKKGDLYRQFELMRRKLSTEREHVEMEIGGMGLPNTYARLYLVYGERLDVMIQSDKEGTDLCIVCGRE